MKDKYRVVGITGREILDSRGTPTVEAEIELACGAVGRAAVPSGASTGSHEAWELRDENPRYQGKGVRLAVSHINTTIRAECMGISVENQREWDGILLELDGTDRKSSLGANAMLAVSLGAAKAMSKALGIPLYQYIGGTYARTLPVPMMNVMNGGRHGDSGLTIQEFMILPVGASTFGEAMEWGTGVYRRLGELLRKRGYKTAVGDEGGYAPDISDEEEALSLLVEAMEQQGFVPGKDISLALDVAGSELSREAEAIGRPGEYSFWKKGLCYTKAQMYAWFERLLEQYPIVSLEDPLGEEDWEGFGDLVKKFGKKCDIIGDDLLVTNPRRIQKGIREQAITGVLVKPNQIGTLWETMEAVRTAKKAGCITILSHRSGETEDVTIADLAVGLGCERIKAGAPARTDRVAKYNQLLRIEERLWGQGCYLREEWENPRSQG